VLSVDTVPRGITKQKYVTAERRALQSIARQTIQTFESFAHVGRSHGQINPCRRTEAKHGYILSSACTNRCSVTLSKPALTAILLPPAQLPACSLSGK
jgi:hypothetical protein